VKRGILLIRVNNQELELDEQVKFIDATMAAWDRTTGKVVKSY
jgi:hypothetical protein